MPAAVSPTELQQILDRAVAAYLARFDELPDQHPEELEGELPYLPPETQVPINEALRWAGYDAFRRAVIAKMRRAP